MLGAERLYARQKRYHGSAASLADLPVDRRARKRAIQSHGGPRKTIRPHARSQARLQGLHGTAQEEDFCQAIRPRRQFQRGKLHSSCTIVAPGGTLTVQAPKIPAPAPASGNTTAKAPPSGPARAANGQPPAPLARAASTAGTTTATSKTLSEQEALRQKVKETRAKTATSNVKEARR